MLNKERVSLLQYLFHQRAQRKGELGKPHSVLVKHCPLSVGVVKTLVYINWVILGMFPNLPESLFSSVWNEDHYNAYIAHLLCRWKRLCLWALSIVPGTELKAQHSLQGFITGVGVYWLISLGARVKKFGYGDYRPPACYLQWAHCECLINIT